MNLAEPLSAPSTASPADRQSLRLIFAYETAAILILAVSLFWTAFFASRQQWPIAAADLLLAGLAAASWAMIRAGSLNSALIVSEVTLMIFTVCYALMFDEPSADIPRITHLYLLVIAMLGYINHLRRRSAFQLLVTAACLVGFIVLSSTTYAFPFARTIPDDIRAGGIWVNSILATAMLCGGIYAIQKEFTRPKGLMLDLSNAVRNRELRLHFQPQVDRTGQIIGAEALMRWQHPDRGLIPPNDFIPAAEAAGLMPLLGGWALAEACRTLSQWQDDPALARLTLAVNVSASQFQLEDFERTVLGTVRRHRIDPARLKLELTESVIVHALAPTVAKMNALRAIGITFALDDFGTGYSSLSYLRRLPVDQLKIDRSFVQESLESDRGGALVRSIVHLGIDLGFVVLAEGIETSAQHAFLLECGCHEFQGYHFGRPVDAAAFADHVRQAAAGGSPALLPAANDRTRRSA